MKVFQRKKRISTSEIDKENILNSRRDVNTLAKQKENKSKTNNKDKTNKKKKKQIKKNNTPTLEEKEYFKKKQEHFDEIGTFNLTESIEFEEKDQPMTNSSNILTEINTSFTEEPLVLTKRGNKNSNLDPPQTILSHLSLASPIVEDFLLEELKDDISFDPMVQDEDDDESDDDAFLALELEDEMLYVNSFDNYENSKSSFNQPFTDL